MSFDPTNASHKAQLYPILKALADLDPRKTPELIMDDAVGYPIPHGKDYARNMRKGQIDKTFARLTYQWLMQYHFDLAHRISPQIFPDTPTKRWRQYLDEHAIKGHLTIQLVPSTMGIVQRDSALQTADDTLKLGQRFCLQLDSAVNDHAIALQGINDRWGVLELAPDRSAVAIIQQGINRLPRLSSGQIDPLSENGPEGLHEFVIVSALTRDIPTAVDQLIIWVHGDVERHLHHMSVRMVG